MDYVYTQKLVFKRNYLLTVFYIIFSKNSTRNKKRNEIY